MHDRFSEEMPWETKPITTDWQGNGVYEGDEGFYDDAGKWIPKEDIDEWVNEAYGIVEFEKPHYL